MSLSPKVSIIVPMFKAEKYLAKCVQSLRDQTLRDIQIVLVDDGSPDKSGQIANSFSREDHRIIVVRRKNGGLGPARNSGMKVATGDYIGFVDSDDWVDTDMFERMYRAAVTTDADVVTTGIRTVRDGRTTAEREQLLAGRVLKGDCDIFRLRSGLYGALPCHSVDAGVVVSACTTLYRRTLLEQQKLHFMKIRSEDVFFNLSVWAAASVVTVMHGTPYNYRKDGQASLTTVFRRSTPEELFHVYRTLEQAAREEPAKFRAEACLRAQRGISDSARMLTEMIEASSEPKREQNALMHEVFNNPSVRRACKDYPFWKLKIDQMLFFICMRFDLVHIARLFLMVHRRFSGK